MPSSMLDKWDYSLVADVCYSDSKCISYKKAAEFLGPTEPVEDWGGGTGWAKRYFTGSYINIDGSAHRNVDVIADLVKYTSSIDNILLRQVLGSNPEWQQILKNVKRSFKKKLCIVVCTELVDETTFGSVRPVCSAEGVIIEEKTIQEVLFNKHDILDYFPEKEGYKVEEEEIATEQYIGTDWILYVEKIS